MPGSTIRSRAAARRAPGFAEEALRQSALVDADHEFDEVMDFIEHASMFDEDKADDPAPDAPR